MTRTDVAIQDIATALCNLPANTPNRQATFVKTLEALLCFAISEYQVDQFVGAQSDLARVDELLQQSKNS
jgi:hypothetical protein